MKLSARNQLPGTVKSVKLGAVMAEVVVKLDGGEELTSAITVNSVQNLGIAEGSRVYVVVKATEVMLGVD
ncbi:MAG: TOBE domain-containing protein [Caldilinea sp.]|nr:TOBE domain-containing protein [Caldilinea sp.]MCB0147879.1 TOBE domain-containing protein [Caldilineaceae bacterium]MCB9125461.1 TOBE domain-containing protein [Caldilineaceae bacterium]MCO5213256.1 TOBE domain-containing protein [Caldilinea sp.]